MVVVLAQKYKKFCYLYQITHKKHCSVSLNVYNLWISSLGAPKLISAWGGVAEGIKGCNSKNKLQNAWIFQIFTTFAASKPRWRNGRRARFRCEC